MNQRDYVGMWFLARRATGIDDNMNLGVMLPDGSQQWYTKPHAEYDGVSALYLLFKEWGAGYTPMPPSRETHPPSLLELWQRGALKNTKAPRCNWRRFADPDQDYTQGKAISSHVFDKATTHALQQFAKDSGVPLMAWVLWAKHRMVMSELCDQPEGARWLLPVTVRGPVRLAREEMNHSSAVNLDVPANASAKDIQQIIRAALKSGQHWWAWRQAHIGRYIGQRGVNWLYRRISQRTRCGGSFSFIGDWELDWSQSRYPEGTVIIASPPGSPSYPVSSGILNTNGNLSISLRLFYSMGVGRARRERCLALWRDHLLGLLENQQAKSASTSVTSPQQKTA